MGDSYSTENWLFMKQPSTIYRKPPRNGEGIGLPMYLFFKMFYAGYLTKFIKDVNNKINLTL